MKYTKTGGVTKGEVGAAVAGVSVEHSTLKKLGRLEPHDTEGSDVFTAEEFAGLRAVGAIIPDDGCGYWATADGFSDFHNCFGPKPEWATHVAWFNR